MDSLKEVILRFDQEELFALYFDISVNDVIWSTSNGANKLNNPLRNDKEPSLTFRWYGDRLFARDWGDFNYSGDIFKIVAYILNVTTNDPKGFVEVCNHIINSYKKKKVSFVKKTSIEVPKLINITKIEINPRTTCGFDYKMFNKFGIVDKQIDRYVTTVHSFYVNDVMSGYRYSKEDPCYRYRINGKYTKLYFPNRAKGSKRPRFITNNILMLDDLDTLRPCTDIILVKSIKDKMLCEQFMDKMQINSIDIKTLSTESNVLQSPLVKALNNSAVKNIFTMSDIDTVGIAQMNEFKKLYGYIPLYFNTKAKDPTDYCYKYGYAKAYQSFKEIISFIISNRNKRQILEYNELK